MSQSSNIFLVGFMGCGKSSLGKKIADKLKFNFIDIDKEIEKEVNLSVSEIFSTYGEDFFRLKESQFLNEISISNCVFATGGGLPCFNDNMSVLNNLGTTVYLQLPAKELLNRLVNDKSNRPLIKSLSNDELLEYINESLLSREPVYKKSDIVLSRTEQNPGQIIQLIQRHLYLQKG